MPIRAVEPYKVRTRTRKKVETVGYKKPPKSSQFKPGQSGNPKGRPKKSRNTDKLIEEILEDKIRYVENGHQTEATVLELLFRKITEKGLKGDLRSAMEMITRYIEIQTNKSVANDNTGPSLEEVHSSDIDMLKDLAPNLLDDLEGEA